MRLILPIALSAALTGCLEAEAKERRGYPGGLILMGTAGTLATSF
ncbi:hypothetical protein [Microbulbifer variabilis]|nr:hypothetical protein [Microbulbifer variabilis]